VIFCFASVLVVRILTALAGHRPPDDEHEQDEGENRFEYQPDHRGTPQSAGIALLYSLR
jgi:hypothetical protein